MFLFFWAKELKRLITSKRGERTSGYSVFVNLMPVISKFLSGSKISDRIGNYLESKGKWSNSFYTFFHAFGYNTKDNLNISTLD